MTKLLPFILLFSGCATSSYPLPIYVRMYDSLEAYCARMNNELKDQLQKCEFPKAYAYERCLDRIHWPEQITEKAAQIIADGCKQEAELSK